MPPKRRKDGPSVSAKLPRQSFAVPIVSFLVALGLSAFLAWISVQAGGVPGCDGGSGCDEVLSSKWSRLFGLPVSLFAMAVYGVILSELFRRAPRPIVYFPLAVLVLSSALWFVALQALVLRAFCPYCMTAHVAGAVGAIFLLRHATLPSNVRRWSGAVAVATVGLMAGAQAITPPPKAVRVQISSTNVVDAASTRSGASAPGPSPAAQEEQVRPVFSVLKGQFTLDLTQTPVIGPIRGSRRVLKLFDYTCHHCRHLHHLLHEYMSTNELTVVMLPMPLDSACNPIVRRTQAAHVNACEYARLALAVFRSNPARFGEFSDWLFAPQRPPPLTEARAQAEALVGAMSIESWVNSPEVNRLIQTSTSIYQTSSRAAGSGRMPQLLFESSASVGAIETMTDLQSVLAGGFAPPGPLPSSGNGGTSPAASPERTP